MWTRVFISFWYIHNSRILAPYGSSYTSYFEELIVFQKWLCHFTYSNQQCIEDSDSSPSLSTLFIFFIIASLVGTLAWKIPWAEEPGRLQSMASLKSQTRLRDDFHFSLSCIGEGNGNPLQCSCLENPRDGGAWWAAVYGVAQSRTPLK